MNHALDTDARFLDAARPEATGAPPSGIVEVFNYGQNRQGLMPLWVGEGDLPTAANISAAAQRSLAAGETFYVAQRGHPDFRAAVARMMARVYGTPFADDKGAKTSVDTLHLGVQDLPPKFGLTSSPEPCRLTHCL